MLTRRPEARRALGGEAPGGLQELQRGLGQLVIVARPDEAALADVVVHDPRARRLPFPVERIEHQDAGLARHPAVVEESEVNVLKQRALVMMKLLLDCEWFVRQRM